MSLNIMEGLLFKVEFLFSFLQDLELIPESSCHSRCVKSPGFDDRKLAHISNIGPICDRSNRGDLTRASDTNFWELALGSSFVIITDNIVEALYGKKLLQKISEIGFKAHLFSFPHGESAKTRKTVADLQDKMFDAGIGRDSALLALGGGVVSDIGGFVASTYCRGIPLVTIPTTLLGMADACIGGKNGINTAAGKNLLGTFYQPRSVLIDVSLLETLPQEELINGYVEMIKHAVIADASYLAFLEKNGEALFSKRNSILQEAIFRSCEIKKSFFEQDEREKKKRMCLNFGHTVAHALEAISQFSIPHGRAVAFGIIIESAMSVQKGVLQTKSFERIKKLVEPFCKEISLNKSPKALFDVMILDKKTKQGIPHFVLLEDIGKVHEPFLFPLDREIFFQVLKEHDYLFHQ